MSEKQKKRKAEEVEEVQETSDAKKSRVDLDDPEDAPESKKKEPEEVQELEEDVEEEEEEEEEVAEANRNADEEDGDGKSEGEERDEEEEKKQKKKKQKKQKKSKKRKRSTDQTAQKRKTPPVGSSGGNSSSRKRPLVASEVVEFLSELAKNPYKRVTESNVYRAEILSLRDRLYVGPPLVPRKKPGASTPSTTAGGGSAFTPVNSRKKYDRPCSPSLFAQDVCSAKGFEGRAGAKQRDPQSGLGQLQNVVSSQLYFSVPPDANDNSLRLKASRALLHSKPNKSSETVPLVGLQHHSTLGALVSPLYRPSLEELWSPREVALFEAGICNYGKRFHCISKHIKSKTTKEVVDFYYIWKKTDNYQIWKRTFD